MKRILLLTVMSLLVVSSFAQIKSFTIDASKVYDNGTRTAYLTLEGDLDEEIIQVIETELLKHPEIVKFSFDKSDLHRLMFESQSELTEEMVVGMIKDIIVNYTPIKPSDTDFAKFEDFGELRFVYFHVTGFANEQDQKYFIEALAHSKYVISVERFDDGLYKVKAEQGLTCEDISTLLKTYGASLDENFIKN